MSYTKFAAAFVRANSGGVGKIRVSPGRSRSTAASAESREQKERPMDGCAVVEAVEPLELISRGQSVAEKRPSKVHIDFDNTLEAYRSKGNIELLRSLLVFKLCTIDVLVEKNKEVSLLS